VSHPDKWRAQSFSYTSAGELCGAIQLDTRFRELLKSKVTAEVWEQISDSNWIFDRQWEMSLKQEFTTRSNASGKSNDQHPIYLGLSAADPKNPHVVILSKYTNNATNSLTQVQAN